jgi:hypothetical protein
MAERVHDGFPRGPADAARLRAVPLEHADPLVLLASAFEQDVDIALPCVAFEEIKDEQPFVLLPYRHAMRIAARPSGWPQRTCPSGDEAGPLRTTPPFVR